MPPTVTFHLPGWALLWAEVDVVGEEAGAQALALLRRVESEVREERRISELANDPVVAGMRRLFRAAGTDPTRYRPSSEALLRRVLKGEEVPSIHPLVDLNNALSLRLAVPCCVMAEGTTAPPYALRAGAPGESYLSLRGPFDLAGKPLLVDADGPCDTPITGNERVKAVATTRRAAMVAYLPAEALPAAAAERIARDLIEAVPAISARSISSIRS